eukprot:TRINITY_DN23501_c0_g2_i2.p1 TRINITY_DN23501_c0_g2~~TRINITY_DN23501_c0_g2_i2.p1  ORF type:complete len:1903 (-),score=570.81 TRINITY_DN23501_c0_g2_i2:455-6163(-)
MRSRGAQWKTEKNKVKIVFRLQLHATQVPQQGWDKLFVSFVPLETGKLIAKTQKAPVRNGICKWSDPIYETTRLLQDPKTKKFEEKLYKLLVLSASSRNGSLGEAIINLADYAEALKPSSISLALASCSFGTTLHVTIEPLTGKTGFREFEQQREVSGKSTGVLTTANDQMHGTASHSDHKIDDQICGTSTSSDGSDASKQFSNGAHGNNDACKLGNVELISMNDKKQGFLTVNEIGKNAQTVHSKLTEKCNTNQAVNVGNKPDEFNQYGSNGISEDGQGNTKVSMLPGESLKPQKSTGSPRGTLDCEIQAEQPGGGLPFEWLSDQFGTDGLVDVYDENKRLKENLHNAEISVTQLQAELACLKRQAENHTVTFTEKENFGKGLFNLNLETHDVNDQNNVAHEDSADDALEVTDSETCMKTPIQKFATPKHLAKDLDSQMGKTHKAYAELLLSIQRSSSEKLSTDTGQNSAEEFSLHTAESKSHSPKVVHMDCSEQLLCLENKIRFILNKLSWKDLRSFESLQNDLQELENMFQDLMKGHIGTLKRLAGKQGERDTKFKHNERIVCDVQKVTKAGSELAREACNSSRTLKEQAKNDYETVISDLEEQLLCLEHSKGQIQEELENLRAKHTGSLSTINALEGQVERLQKELSEQAAKFSLSNEDMDQCRRILEQRASKAEAALKRMQSHNAHVVQNLQCELEHLSIQLHSSFETNKTLVKQAFTEASELEAQKNDIEYQLEIVKAALQQSNLEISTIKTQNEERIQELVLQLNASKKNEEELSLKLQDTAKKLDSQGDSHTEDVLRINKLSERLMLQENEFKNLAKEKSSLFHKVEKLEAIELERESNKRIINDLKTEKTVIETSLRKVSQEKKELEKELVAIKENLSKSNEDITKMQCSNVELENTIASLQSKLNEQLGEIKIYHAQKKELTETQDYCNKLNQRISEHESEIKSMQQLLDMHTELQQQAETKVLQLQSSNKALEEHSSDLLNSLQNARGEIELSKKESEAKVSKVVEELELSNRHREELTSRLNSTLKDNARLQKTEATYTEKIQQLSHKVSELETHLQTLMEDRSSLTEKVVELDDLREELETVRTSWNSSVVEIANLEASFQKISREKSALEGEVQAMRSEKEDSNRELDHFKDLVNELEKTISSLQSGLDENNSQLSFYNEQEYELLQLKKQHADLQKNLLDLQAEKEELLRHSEVEATELHMRIKNLELKIADFEHLFEKSNEQALLLKEAFENKQLELDDSIKQKNDALTELQIMARELEEHTKREAECLSLNEDMSVRLSKLDAEAKAILKEKKNLEQKVQDLEAAKMKWDAMKREFDICTADKLRLEDSLKMLEEQMEKVNNENSALKKRSENLKLKLTEIKSYNCELEAKVRNLQTNLDEKSNQLRELSSEHSSLKQSFSEQNKNVEELREHLVHLKELQMKAEAEACELHLQMKELENEKAVAHESLRIALIREQFEAKERELTSHLEHSNKESEELLLKLQDTLKELETYKRNEAQQVKKMEGLSKRCFTLESELKQLSNENNNLLQKLKDINSVKSDYEGQKVNLEKYKAEKAGLENLLWKNNIEKQQLEDEVNSLKEMLRYSDKEFDDLKLSNEKREMEVASLQAKIEAQSCQIMHLNNQIKEQTRLQELNDELNDALSKQEAEIREVKQHNLHLKEEIQQRIDEFTIIERTLKDKILEQSEMNLFLSQKEKEHSHLQVKVKLLEDELKSRKRTSDISEKGLHSNAEQLDVEIIEANAEIIQSENFDSCMDQLQREVNQQLENMFPNFKEPAKGGNAIERVLALERELADALKESTTNRRQFQSSFVKQLADQAAMLQSFRDINELINDMLQIKRKNSLLEDELKELQSRYSQMSLKFAEVEGERQKLIMTLKSTRTGKK